MEELNELYEYKDVDFPGRDVKTMLEQSAKDLEGA